jgi:acetyltransferase-like isoleucine patch superfamily enzyme
LRRFRPRDELRARIARAWTVFDTRATVPADYRLGPSAWCANNGPADRIRLGAGGICRGILRREDFGDGQIIVGADVYIGDDCIISASDRIEIGSGTLLGHGVQIFDNNSHPVEATARGEDAELILAAEVAKRQHIDHAPVTIGANAWLGFGAIVLKGVTIGDGAIVAAGSVVAENVDVRAVVAGNPARLVKRLD